MDNSTDEYHISFFKPTTERARFNKKLVLWLVSVWFIAIFGFQILLRIVQKPTPEPSYLSYENVWDNVKSGNASASEYQEFGVATLSILGKVAIAPDERIILDNALSYSVLQLIPDSMQQKVIAHIKKFEFLQENIVSISDPEYLAEKASLTKHLSPRLGLSDMDVRTKLLPLELKSENITDLTDETVNKLPGIMKKYLVHNQSFLTDAKFLGFPFHYFYTAVFLLILFVGLCWIYCVTIDKYNKKMGIED